MSPVWGDTVKSFKDLNDFAPENGISNIISAAVKFLKCLNSGLDFAPVRIIISMKNFYRAEDVFKNFSNKIKSKIFAVGKGKLVYFPKNQNKKQKVNQEDVLIRYVQNGKKSYSQIGDELGVSKVRIFQIIKLERKRFSKERVEYWKRRGLSLREIARLFKKSHENVRQIIY